MAAQAGSLPSVGDGAALQRPGLRIAIGGRGLAPDGRGQCSSSSESQPGGEAVGDFVKKSKFFALPYNCFG